MIWENQMNDLYFFFNKLMLCIITIYLLIHALILM